MPAGRFQRSMPSSVAETSRAEVSKRDGPRIDGERLWKRLMAMADIGRRGETGVDRSAFSPEDRAARRLLYEWGCEHGLEATQDSIGNLFLRYPGQRPELPAVLTGSHMDSQPSGDRFVIVRWKCDWPEGISVPKWKRYRQWRTTSR